MIQKLQVPVETALTDGGHSTAALPAFSRLEVHYAGQLHLIVAPGDCEVSFPSAWQLPPAWRRVKDGLLVLDEAPATSTPLMLRTPSLQEIVLTGRGTLFCSFRERCPWLRLKLTGAGMLEWSGEADELEVLLSGAGTIKLSGQARSLNASSSGSGDLRAFGLEADNLWLRGSGSGRCEVNVRQRLKAQIEGSGEVDYRGYPEIEFSKHAAGRLVNAN